MKKRILLSNIGFIGTTTFVDKEPFEQSIDNIIKDCKKIQEYQCVFYGKNIKVGKGARARNRSAFKNKFHK
jgi:hypothetical protein